MAPPATPPKTPTDGPAAEPFAELGDASEDVHPRALEITQMLGGELARADFQGEGKFFDF